MLRKRSRSVQKDQHQMGHSGAASDSVSESSKNPKNSSFYTIPGILVGLTPKGFALTDCDSVRSPTSPLDFRVFSGLGNPFRSSSSSIGGHQRGFNGGGASKLGLISIIDSEDGEIKSGGKVVRSSSSVSSEGSKNILFGPRLRAINRAPNGSPKSLPENYAVSAHYPKPRSPLRNGGSVLFEIADSPLLPDPFGKIRSCSLDSCFAAPLGEKLVSTGEDLSIGSLSASEIELSEDYTCVISHGPNPKTTHIFGDCILEETKLGNGGHPVVSPSSEIVSVPYFLSFCHSCNKKLEDNEDIYIYRGEKAFCSLNCRSLEILIDEELEKSSDRDDDDGNDELFF